MSEAKPATGPTKHQIKEVMVRLEEALPDCTIALIVTPRDPAAGDNVNYISNGKREDIREILKGLIAVWKRSASPAAVDDHQLGPG